MLASRAHAHLESSKLAIRVSSSESTHVSPWLGIESALIVVLGHIHAALGSIVLTVDTSNTAACLVVKAVVADELTVHVVVCGGLLVWVVSGGTLDKIVATGRASMIVHHIGSSALIIRSLFRLFDTVLDEDVFT